ncbi:unnamed protein product [Angiostrongylus costaricensis]|uniref:UPF0113_N domain-containing protein n=1 Tax=Angiostrongylus costaricensis TaxID=334426 RepID=A0A0R3PFW1_ANGCS|nr:unnamed protein product [Angiostrongylus costaricensis]
MRPLTDEETEKVFSKLATFIGDNVALLIDRADGDYCFRNHKLCLERVYYCSESLMRQAGCIAREPLLSFGTCLGKFTKSHKFHLHVTALDYLAPYAKVICTFLSLLLLCLYMYVTGFGTECVYSNHIRAFAYSSGRTRLIGCIKAPPILIVIFNFFLRIFVEQTRGVIILCSRLS